MMRLSELVTMLVEQVPIAAGEPEDGLVLGVAELEIEIPIEARIGHDGTLLATPPRGRLATGFSIPHARIYARFDVREG